MQVIIVIPKERISERCWELIKEEIVKVVQIMDVRTEEQIVDVPVLQLQETVEVSMALSKQRTH